MKKKLFLLALLAVTNLAYGYRHVPDNEHIVPIEKGAYEDLLRTIDEYNRLNGKSSNYLGNLKDSTKDIDIIAIAQFTNNGKYMEDSSTKKGFYRGEGYHTLADLLQNGSNSLKENGTIKKLPFVEVGDTKRFYFGNGNVINDIKFTKANDFKENADKAQKENNVRHHLTGSYLSIDTEKMNQLNISMDDYKNKIEGKSKEDVAKYLQEKLKSEKKIETIIKNGELYTKDDKGKEWKVLYDLEPVSVFQGEWADQKYKDTVFSKIFVYKSSSENGMSTGDILYTNDGNILIEDKYTYNDGIRLPNSNKNLEELIKEGENSSNSVIRDYFKDKKELGENSEKFKEKWITPFKKGGDFDKAYTAMQSELTQAKQKEAILKKNKDELYSKAEKIKNNSKFPGDFSEYENGNDKKKEEYLSNKSEEVKKLIKEYETINKEYKDIDKKYWDNLTAISDGIPKKHGFSNSWNATDEQKKWSGLLGFIVKDDTLTSEVTTKNLEFRGKGRINGTVDLGEGYNKITITEHLSGEFGTNIILGPEAALKNVDIVYIGGGTGTNGSVSISGKTSLALDIDKNVKNSEGELIQHAFRNSDKDIIFSNSSSANPDSRNNFSIQMMVSRLDEDSVINMGRKLDYEGRNPNPTGNNDYSIPETLNYKINMISDSIAHDLVKLDKTDKDGNTLMKVTLKDSIKMLDNNENDIYRSIKNSGYLGSLHETLTTTNKKTTFSVAEDEQEETKELKIASYLREKSADDLIKDLSQVGYNETTKNKVKKMISNLKERQEVKDAQIAQKQLNNWKKDPILNNSLNTLNGINVDKTLGELNNYSQEEKKAKYNEIKDIYNKNISSLYNKVYQETQKLASSKELSNALSSLDSCFSSWKDESYLEESLKAIKEVTKKIENLMKDNGVSIDKELSDALKKLEYKTSDYTYDYKNLYDTLFYTMRQEESLKELKILLDQVYEKNIYSRLNKISKDEINVFTYIPFNIKYNFEDKNSYVNGGSISTRNSMDGFKGNIYTGYGIYETKYNDNMNLGFIVGGGTSNHKEMKNDSLDKTTTESKIKGTTAYLGGYSRINLKNNFEWINGGGIQYGKYDITRNFRNSYQSDSFSGDAETKSFNAYSGLIYKYDLNDSLALKARGVLSYTFINQSDINEDKKPLSLDIKSQNYNYLDGETGVSLVKTILGNNSQSSISGGIYSVLSLVGSDNDDLTGRFNNSTSSFNIKGNDYKKNSIKMFLDYNFYKDTGLNYGIEGGYTVNDDEDNITIGVKVGYTF